MLRITIPLTEGYNEETQEFDITEGFELKMEHSLASLSKWECKWEKPFLGNDQKTDEQVRDYIRMMILGEIPPEETLSKLSSQNITEIDTYIEAKMTATWFNEPKKPPTREVITAEIIYYWMTALNIPFECENWHLTRLLTLIKVCNFKNAPTDKMSPAARAQSQRDLNAQRRAELGTKG
jgi:hypothetical protein